MSELMTLEEVWDELRKNPETKATMEEADKAYDLFKKVEKIMLTDAENKIKNLKEQLAEKDKRIKELKGKHTVVVPARMNGKTRLCHYNLLKIQNEQAIEELEKLRKTLPEKNNPIYPITILKQIDKQIYELRGGDYVKNI